MGEPRGPKPTSVNGCQERNGGQNFISEAGQETVINTQERKQGFSDPKSGPLEM